MYDNLRSLLEIVAMVVFIDFIVMLIAIFALKIEFGEGQKLSAGLAIMGVHTVVVIFVTWGVVG